MMEFLDYCRARPRNGLLKFLVLGVLGIIYASNTFNQRHATGGRRVTRGSLLQWQWYHATQHLLQGVGRHNLLSSSRGLYVL